MPVSARERAGKEQPGARSTCAACVNGKAAWIMMTAACMAKRWRDITLGITRSCELHRVFRISDIKCTASIPSAWQHSRPSLTRTDNPVTWAIHRSAATPQQSPPGKRCHQQEAACMLNVKPLFPSYRSCRGVQSASRYIAGKEINGLCKIVCGRSVLLK